jgi:hypothetical protein
MIFSELYSAYYHTVAEILRAAVQHPVGTDEVRGIIRTYAFGESAAVIEPALREGRWPLLRQDGATPLRHTPTLPLTTLEKRWLKAIALDPRVQLFGDALPELVKDWPEVRPLFTPEDVTVFDRYADGDPYEDPAYRARFRVILAAIRAHTPLYVDSRNRKGGTTHMVLLPEALEYSEKDDKFRLIGSGCRYGGTVNLGRIVACRPCTRPYEVREVPPRDTCRTVVFELKDERNTLERALLHFAHFEKQAEKLGDGNYRVSVTYDADDEAEMVIRLLAFGPMIRVTEPEAFVEKIKERLTMQKSCGL